MSTQRRATGSAADDRGRGLSTWWYLIYLGMLAFQPLFDPTTTAVDWALAILFAAAGAGWYVYGERETAGQPAAAARRKVVAAVAFALLGAIAVWLNSGAAVFFVYAAAFAGTFEPRRRAQRWLLGLTLTLTLLTVLSPIPMPYRLAAFGFPLVFVWIVGYQVMEDAERERESRRLRVDNARIEQLATLGERERIARDLHDLLGHTLTGILVRAQLIERLAHTDPRRAAKEAGAVERLARDALSEVRTTVSGWRHHALDVELDAARDALVAAGVDIVVEQDTGLSMSPAVEAALALALREAVTNVVRHAAAGRCRVVISGTGEQIRLTVDDDGVGGGASEGAGLTGMRERVGALGGRVERDARLGTTLRVTLPAQEVAV